MPKLSLSDSILLSISPPDWVLAYGYWLLAVAASTCAVVLAVAFIVWIPPAFDIGVWPWYCRALFLLNCAAWAWIVMSGLSRFRSEVEAPALT